MTFRGGETYLVDPIVKIRRGDFIRSFTFYCHILDKLSFFDLRCCVVFTKTSIAAYIPVVSHVLWLIVVSNAIEATSQYVLSSVVGLISCQLSNSDRLYVCMYLMIGKGQIAHKRP